MNDDRPRSRTVGSPIANEVMLLPRHHIQRGMDNGLDPLAESGLAPPQSSSGRFLASPW